jgi:hypothetical protein
MTTRDLESKGLNLRRPESRLVLEVPAEFGWDNRGMEEQLEILKTFGFDCNRKLTIRREKTGIGTLCQISQ